MRSEPRYRTFSPLRVKLGSACGHTLVKRAQICLANSGPETLGHELRRKRRLHGDSMAMSGGQMKVGKPYVPAATTLRLFLPVGGLKRAR